MSYLTEKSLGDILAALGKKPEAQFSIGRFRYDFVLPSDEVLVEFDGYHHFQDPATIYRDKVKTELAVKEGFRLVRIPYFVQWCSTVAARFGIKSGPKRPAYPHGFIDSKALLPAAYCQAGLAMFEAALKEYPELRDEILGSLYTVDKPSEVVFPDEKMAIEAKRAFRRLSKELGQ